MKVSNNRYFQEDIENAAASTAPDWEQFRGKSILVTGSTGLLGSQLVLTLLMANEQKSLGLKVYALVRSEEKAKKVFSFIDSDDLVIVKGDVMNELDIDADIDFIIHAANPTSSKYFVEHPVETVKATVGGTENVLKLAVKKNITSMVFLSSLDIGVPVKPIYVAFGSVSRIIRAVPMTLRATSSPSSFFVILIFSVRPYCPL